MVDVRRFQLLSCRVCPGPVPLLLLAVIACGHVTSRFAKTKVPLRRISVAFSAQAVRIGAARICASLCHGVQILDTFDLACTNFVQISHANEGWGCRVSESDFRNRP